MEKLELRISLRHLRLVDAIEREGSFVRAAESLNMTQSAVTKALQEVEALSGVPLFTRTRRGSLATPYGALLADHARTVMAQLKRASRELTQLQDGGGSVVVGTLPSAAGWLLPHAIAEVMARRQQLRVKIVEGQHGWLTTLLRRSDLDLVVGRLPPGGRPEDIAQEILGPDHARLVVRAGHPLTRDKTLTLAALSKWHWILPPPEASLRRQIDTAFQEAGLVSPEAKIESMSFLTNRTLLLGADFISVWPQHLAVGEARTGHVAMLPIALPTTERPIGVWWRSEPGLSPAAQLIVQALRDEFNHDSRVQHQGPVDAS